MAEPIGIDYANFVVLISGAQPSSKAYGQSAAERAQARHACPVWKSKFTFEIQI